MKVFLTGSLVNRLKRFRFDSRGLLAVLKPFGFKLSLAVITFSIGIGSVWLLVRRWSRRPASKAAIAVQTLPVATSPLSVLKPVGELPETLSRNSGASIQFFDDKYGFVSMNGKLWRTTEGGFDWRMMFSVQPRPDEYPPWLGQFKFIDAEHGWLVSNQTLYKTEDAGLHWQIIDQPIEYNVRDLAPVGITDFALLPDGQHAWIIGTEYRSLKKGEEYYHTRYSTADGKKVMTPLVYYTGNAGRTWTRQSLPGNAYELWTIEAFDEDHAWATELAGTFYFRDGKWSDSNTTESPESQNMEEGCLTSYIGAPTNAPDSFFFIDANNGWITNTNGFWGRTTDGGEHWQDVPGDGLSGGGQSGGLWQTTRGMTVHFFDKVNGYGLDGDGFLRRTSDGGATWEMIDKSMIFTDLFAHDPKNVWVASSAGIFKVPSKSTSGSE